MFEKFWEIIREKDSLLDQSKKQSLSMLHTCKESKWDVALGFVADGNLDAAQVILSEIKKSSLTYKGEDNTEHRHRQPKSQPIRSARLAAKRESERGE